MKIFVCPKSLTQWLQKWYIFWFKIIQETEKWRAWSNILHKHLRFVLFIQKPHLILRMYVYEHNFPHTLQLYFISIIENDSTIHSFYSWIHAVKARKSQEFLQWLAIIPCLVWWDLGLETFFVTWRKISDSILTRQFRIGHWQDLRKQ